MPDLLALSQTLWGLPSYGESGASPLTEAELESAVFGVQRPLSEILPVASSGGLRPAAYEFSIPGRGARVVPAVNPWLVVGFVLLGGGLLYWGLKK